MVSEVEFGFFFNLKNCCFSSILNQIQTIVNTTVIIDSIEDLIKTPNLLTK